MPPIPAGFLDVPTLFQHRPLQMLCLVSEACTSLSQLANTYNVTRLMRLVWASSQLSLHFFGSVFGLVFMTQYDGISLPLRLSHQHVSARSWESLCLNPSQCLAERKLFITWKEESVGERDRETGAGRGGWGGSGKEEERNFHSIKRHKTSLSVCCNYQISPL